MVAVTHCVLFDNITSTTSSEHSNYPHEIISVKVVNGGNLTQYNMIDGIFW